MTSSGSLEARIGIGATRPTTSQAYSASYYRDDGWQCDATQCGTAVPLGAAFTTRLRQDGSFTLGSANFGLSYTLRTAAVAYNFHFAVQQGEMDLEPYGWFSTENLVSGGMTQIDLFDPSFNLVWEDDNDDGIYNFSYDFSFSGHTHGVDLGEELGISACVRKSSRTILRFLSLLPFDADARGRRRVLQRQRPTRRERTAVRVGSRAGERASPGGRAARPGQDAPNRLRSGAGSCR